MAEPKNHLTHYRDGKASRQNNVAIIRDWCYPRIPWKVLSHR